MMCGGGMSGEGEAGHSCSQEPRQVSPLHHSPLFLWLIYVQVEVLFLAEIEKKTLLRKFYDRMVPIGKSETDHKMRLKTVFYLLVIKCVSVLVLMKNTTGTILG